MDPAEESHLRASGAKIGDANRAQWHELLAGRTLADVAWATAAALTKSRERQVDVTEVAQALKARPPKATPAAPAAPISVPSPQSATGAPSRGSVGPKTEANISATECAGSTPAAAGVPAEPAAGAGEGTLSRPLQPAGRARAARRLYLSAILDTPGISMAELTRVAGRSYMAVSNWLSGNGDLVVRSPGKRNGVALTLTPKGRASAAALGIEIGKAPAATITAPPADDLISEPTPAPPADDRPACDPPAPDEHPPTDAIDQVADALEQAWPAPRTDFDSSDLEKDLAALFASHVTRNGYAATMRALTRARFLFGIGA